MPRKSSKDKFHFVKSVLPAGSTFHEQKGPLIWLTKKHLERIEQNMQVINSLKKRNFELEKIVAKHQRLANNLLKSTATFEK